MRSPLRTLGSFCSKNRLRKWRIFPPAGLGADRSVKVVEPINVKSPARSPRQRSRTINTAMVQRRLTNNEMHRLGPCLAALRILAQSKDLRRDILIEQSIDEYLKTDPFSLAHALERLRRAIHYEEIERRQGEDWSVARNYVRVLLHRMTS
jgi:hypothetical protein